MTTGAVTGQGIVLTCNGDAIAGSTNYTLTFNQGSVDVTSRDDAFQSAYLKGRRDWTIDIDALYVYTDVGTKVLINQANAGLAGATTVAAITVILTTAASVTYTGTANVTSFAMNMPAEEGVTYTCSLQGTGVLTMSAS